MQKSHLSPDFTFHAPGYRTIRKGRSVTSREITNPTENLKGAFILVGLTYSSLSTKHLFSLDLCFNYLAITVKIKPASSIHFFNLNPPSIHSSFSDIHSKYFSLFLLSSSPTTFIFGNFNCHRLSWDSQNPED